MGTLGNTAVPGVQSLLSQHFGNVFVGTLLISTQIDQCVRVAHQALPIVLEQSFQSGDILQDNGGHDVAGAHGSLELTKIVRQGDVAELVHHQPDRDGQRPLVYLVRLIVEGLKRAGVEHPHKVVECTVIIGDDGKDGLLAVPHQAQFHIVPRGDAHDLRDDERGQPDGGGQKNTFRGFA